MTAKTQTLPGSYTAHRLSMELADDARPAHIDIAYGGTLWIRRASRRWYDRFGGRCVELTGGLVVEATMPRFAAGPTLMFRRRLKPGWTHAQALAAIDRCLDQALAIGVLNAPRLALYARAEALPLAVRVAAEEYGTAHGITTLYDDMTLADIAIWHGWFDTQEKV